MTDIRAREGHRAAVQVRTSGREGNKTYPGRFLFDLKPVQSPFFFFLDQHRRSRAAVEEEEWAYIVKTKWAHTGGGKLLVRCADKGARLLQKRL